MRCPYCNNNETQVKDSRPTEDNAVIRRRRHCADCGGRFTTFERIQLRELTIDKNTGRKVPFDRDKLMRSVQIALRKRPVEQERVERMVSGIVRRLENLGEGEIYLNEVNTLPGMTPISLFPKLLESSGVKFFDYLTDRIINRRLSK